MWLCYYPKQCHERKSLTLEDGISDFNCYLKTCKRHLTMDNINASKPDHLDLLFLLATVPHLIQGAESSKLILSWLADL